MNRKVKLGCLLMLCAGVAFAGDYPTGTYPKFIISADFRNDGIKDIVTANYHDSSISVLLGNGNGTLEPAVNYPVGAYPTGLSAADFRGNGKLDLVVANAINPHQTSCPTCGLQGVSVLLGNGDGTFQPNVFYAVASGTAWVSAKDVNGDGIPDIIAAAYHVNAVSVLLGNGDGTFQPAINIRVGKVPHSIAVADFNGDGIPDLAVGNMYSNNVEILIGVGNGHFKAGATFAVGQVPHSICHGDFNGDGKVDLASANINSDNVTVLLGNGDGTFQPGVNYPTGKGTTSVYPADFNGDGITDLVAANSGATSGGHRPGGHGFHIKPAEFRFNLDRQGRRNVPAGRELQYRVRRERGGFNEPDAQWLSGPCGLFLRQLCDGPVRQRQRHLPDQCRYYGTRLVAESLQSQPDRHVHGCGVAVDGDGDVYKRVHCHGNWERDDNPGLFGTLSR